MGKMERLKGQRVEREIVNWHRQNKIHAERVPDSGASRYQGSGHDVDIYPWGRDEAPLVCEVKARRDGIGGKLFRRWLGDFDALFLHEDREDDIVVVTKRTWLKLLKGSPVAVDLSTSIPQKPKNGLAAATSAEPAKSPGLGRKGEANEHPVAS